ncbi:hypothetical protein EIMP300_46770 [Escherichia coli]|uniref:NapC/NirT cytochrome c N-terminal domain-containing protein n=1 Tax=Escherichia coli TaxID=562 RepID=A0A8S0FS68_ECOLX|nr:hypothetical protein EIMP300_46770 [Escherichia coli]
MDISSQSESAQKMHNKAQKDGETCIDCHKGIAHFPPEIKMDDNAAHELESQAATSVTNGAHNFSHRRLGSFQNFSHRRPGYRDSWYRSHRR